MPRDITLTEARAAQELAQNARAIVRRILDEPASPLGEMFKAPPEKLAKDYETALDQIIRIARPNLFAVAKQASPESPTPPLSPEASGAAAAGVASSPPAGSGHPSPSVTAGLLTYEGLHDALIAFHAELHEGTFQPDPGTDAATQQFNYIIRHAERQSDEAEFAAAAAVMGVAA